MQVNHLLEERRRRRSRRKKEEEEDDGGEVEVELDWWRRCLGCCFFFSTSLSVCRNLGLPTSGSTASTKTNTIMIHGNNVLNRRSSGST